jgi:hypothetical protein
VVAVAAGTVAVRRGRLGRISVQWIITLQSINPSARNYPFFFFFLYI